MLTTLTRRRLFNTTSATKLRGATPTSPTPTPTHAPKPASPASPTSIPSASPPVSIKAYMPGGSRYKLKKVWPPDFSKLPAKEQFRFERRFKRRMKLASRRPRWDRFVRLLQLTGVTSVIAYAVLFMEWDQEIQPFQNVRDKFWGVFSSEQRLKELKPSLPGTEGQK